MASLGHNELNLVVLNCFKKHKHAFVFDIVPPHGNGTEMKSFRREDKDKPALHSQCH